MEKTVESSVAICNKCVHCTRLESNYYSARCSHPSNMRVDYLTGELEEDKCAEAINKNGTCPNFQRVPEEQTEPKSKPNKPKKKIWGAWLLR